jgi:hypothetical protein
MPVVPVTDTASGVKRKMTAIKSSFLMKPSLQWFCLHIDTRFV